MPKAALGRDHELWLVAGGRTYSLGGRLQASTWTASATSAEVAAIGRRFKVRATLQTDTSAELQSILDGTGQLDLERVQGAEALAVHLWGHAGQAERHVAWGQVHIERLQVETPYRDLVIVTASLTRKAAGYEGLGVRLQAPFSGSSGAVATPALRTDRNALASAAQLAATAESGFTHYGIGLVSVPTALAAAAGAGNGLAGWGAADPVPAAQAVRIDAGAPDRFKVFEASADLSLRLSPANWRITADGTHTLDIIGFRGRRT